MHLPLNILFEVRSKTEILKKILDDSFLVIDIFFIEFLQMVHNSVWVDNNIIYLKYLNTLKEIERVIC